MRKAQTSVELMVPITLIAIVSLIAVGTGGMRSCSVASPDGKVGDSGPNYSSGIRLGRLMKFSLKGIKYKSWEGIFRSTDD